jgi:ABC-type nickel/cobalt efflux system permease component RcnA
VKRFAFVLLALVIFAPDVLAQARNPFSVGISEGGGSATGITGWILAQQQYFDVLMREAVRAIRNDGAALWRLIGLAFAYGVFHAAGPGHGKAVLAAWMVANERALKRGLAMSALAALLQALVAIVLVVGLALVLGATSRTLRDAAQWVEIASYAAIALVGSALVWRKGRAFLEEMRTKPQVSSGFICEAADDPVHVHGPDCAHIHMPDPALMGGAKFSWRDAAGAVIAAGLRPCSGAILVLVFSSAQGILHAGIAATFAMAAGTALTTGVIAAAAVFFKDAAKRFGARKSSNVARLLRGLELAAACAVLLLGLGLVTGAMAGVS